MKKDGQKIDAASLRSMNAKYFYLIAALLLLTKAGWAAQSYPSTYPATRSAPGDDLNQLVKQFKTSLADLKHNVHNHETEIRIFEEKLLNQESSFEQQRQQLAEDLQSQRDFVRASNINLEGKIESLDQSLKNLETMIRGTMSDLRQMKTQANDSVSVLSNYKQKMTEFEKLLEAQNLHMQNLEAALQSMMEVWQAKEAAREIAVKGSESSKTYKVQPGDSLEKIARAQKVSVQALRDANQLSNDRIIVGQTLKIP